jgi:uncharacterized protein DUF6600/FecR-like protein
MPTLSVPRVLPLLVASLTWTAGVQAQESPNVAAPAHVAYVDGTVTLERDGTLDPASVNMPIVAGDRLRTASGRIELLFPDGSALDLDEYSSVDVLSPTLLRLVAGRAMMIVAGASDPSAAVRYQLDTPVASVQTDGPGEFRVAVLGSGVGETELAVVRGVASLATERGAIAVRAGERTVALENGAPSFPQTFNSARFDAFDRWVAGRRDARMAASSARYLPRELQTYGGTLDRYGSWQYTEPYGNVWYPTVDTSWRPYYYGSWSPIPSYGWTWIGVDLWSWPTHHYGRWGHANARWFWIPGRTWGPAWVSWAAAPDYVSWCPLGFDGRAVFALSIGVRNRWDGWTVVPRGSFGARDYNVNRHAIQPHQIPRTTPFIVHSSPPVAVPRSVRLRDESPTALRRDRAEARTDEESERRRASRQLASPEAGRRVRTNEGGLPNDSRPAISDGRRVAVDNQPGDFPRRSGSVGSVDRGAGVGERAVPRSSSTDQRSPASSTAAQSGTREDRVFASGRRQDAGSPASTRDFRQPLPDFGRERAVDRATPTPPRSQGVEGPALRNAEPRGPSRDPRQFSTGDSPSLGVGRRPGFGEAAPQRADGFGRVEADRRRANDARPMTPDRPRAPEVAAPRYGRPVPERPAQSAPPPRSSGATFERSAERSGPRWDSVDRAPSTTPESRSGTHSAPATPRSAPASPPPAGRVERSAPGRTESHGGERAVPRGEGSTRGAGRQR